MLEIKVTVEIPGLPEAINNLAGAMRNTPAPEQAAQSKNINEPFAYMNTAPVQSVPVPESGAVAGPAANPMNPPVQTAMPTMTAPPVNAPAAAPSAPAPSDAKALTMDDLGRAGATLIDAGKMPQLIALLGKYGVQAVTQLKPEQFNAFADEMRALGAKF